VNLQNPPTDSLYKFCAIAGLVVVLISVYLPERMVEEFESKASVFILELRKAKVELEFQSKELDSLNKDLTSLRQSLMQKQANKSVQEKSIERTNQAASAIRQTSKTVELKNAEIMTTEEEIKRLGERTRSAVRVGAIGWILGGILAVYGFTNWYRKIQVHQDALIKRQAEQVKSEK